MQFNLVLSLASDPLAVIYRVDAISVEKAKRESLQQGSHRIHTHPLWPRILQLRRVDFDAPVGVE